MLRKLDSRPIVHIPTGTRCNNRCNFCMERSEGYPVEHSLEEYRDTLSRMRAELDSVIFTGGEPTLNPLLPQMVQTARALDYTVIGLVTNARALHRRALCEELLAHGLNKVTVSLHGPRAEVHDAVTRRKGSFDQAVRGLDNLAALRERYPFEWSINCSVVVENVHLMREMRDFALGRGVDHVNFNVVEPRGTADELFESVVPRYSEVMCHAAESGLDFSQPTQSLSRVPACAGGVEWVQESWHLAHHDRVDVYDPAEGKVKGAPCEACALTSQCDGVWARYIEGFGWDEFVPVVHPDERTGQTWRLCTGSPCNNRCVHCVDGPAAPAPPSARPVLQQLRDGLIRGFRRVELGGGEVLLDDRLPQWVQQARDLGWREIVVETNGRALNIPEVLEQLAALGPAEVVIRLNAGDERIHDEMARQPKAFRQTVRGMMQLARRGIPFTVRVRRHDRNAPSLERAEQIALAAGALRVEVVD